MEEQLNQVVSSPAPAGAAEERMLRADLVREIVARAQRGEGAKRIARELGVDRKTVKRWLRLGAWQPRHYQRRPRPIDVFVKFIEQRGPEVGWNGVVLFRQLAGIGFTGSYQQVQRFLKPYRARRKWSELATVRFETEPGEQAQVDYGQLRVWIGEQAETSIYSCSHSVIHAACSRVGIRMSDWRRCSTVTSAPCVISQACRSTVSMIIRATWCWAAVIARCCGIRCSKILPATTGLRRAPASPIGHELRARSKAASSMSNATLWRAGASARGRNSTSGLSGGAPR